MKKVALVLFLSISFVLFLACKGRLSDSTPMPASTPDMLPFYVITLGNCQNTPEPATAGSSVKLENPKIQLEKVKDALLTIFRIYQENNPQTREARLVFTGIAFENCLLRIKSRNR